MCFFYLVVYKKNWINSELRKFVQVSEFWPESKRLPKILLLIHSYFVLIFNLTLLPKIACVTSVMHELLIDQSNFWLTVSIYRRSQLIIPMDDCDRHLILEKNTVKRLKQLKRLKFSLNKSSSQSFLCAVYYLFLEFFILILFIKNYIFHKI